MWVSTTLSKHFMIIGVGATGLQSFRQVGGIFLGRGAVVVVLKQGSETVGGGEGGPSVCVPPLCGVAGGLKAGV